MTISSNPSRPSSTGCTSTIAISSLSSSASQCLPFPSRRPINPPPYRLVFEPVTTSPSTKQGCNHTSAALHQELFPTAKSPQGSISFPSRQAASTTLTPQQGPPFCETSPQDTSAVRGVIYMLHGWAQNVHIFSNRARKLTKRLNKAGYKVVFLQGPHRLPPVVPLSTSVADTAAVLEENQQQSGDGDGKARSSSSFSREYAYAWFLYDNPCNGDTDGDQIAAGNSQVSVLRPSPTGNYRGMDASQAFLRNELRADQNEFRKMGRNQQDVAPATIPPFFLLGFSQGAVLVHKLATLACINGSGDVCDDTNISTNASGCDSGGPWANVQKCILVSGFSFTTSIGRNEEAVIHKSNHADDNHRIEPRQSSDSATRRRIMPSFHVLGRKDSRVSPCLTLELRSLESCFGGRHNHQNVLWEHDRGHVLPQDQEFCNRLLEFLAGP